MSGFALVRTGNLFDPKDKIGLAELTGTVMRSGGTKSKTSEQLDEQLENIAASVEASIGESSGRVGFSALKENTDQVLAIFQDVLTNPEFRQDKLDLAKSQIKSGISRRNDEAGEILSRSFAEIVYGRDNPYGWRMEYQHIDNIQSRRSDRVLSSAISFPRTLSSPYRATSSTADMRAKLEKLFDGWTVKAGARAAIPAGDREARAGRISGPETGCHADLLCLRASGRRAARSEFSGAVGDVGHSRRQLFGTPVQERSHETRPGVFDQRRLGSDLRSSGLFRSERKHEVGFDGRYDSGSLAEVNKMRTSEVTDQELDTAKQSVLNSFVFFFDSPSKTLSRVVTYDYYGYPKDFIFQYQKGVQAVTKADVLRVAKQYLKPENISIVAVGKPSDFGKPLTTLGSGERDRSQYSRTRRKTICCAEVRQRQPGEGTEAVTARAAGRRRS